MRVPLRRWTVLSVVVALVFFIAAGGHVAGFLAIGIVALVGLVWLAAARPAVSLVGIIVWVPVQVSALAFLYRHGAPALLVKNLGYLKEFWEIALLCAVFRQRRVPRPFDALDWIITAYIAIATAELLLPFVAPGTLGGNPFNVRLNAWRLDAMFMVVFLCVRRLDWDPQIVRSVRLAVFFVGAVLAGFALWEATDNSGFNDFLLHTIDLPSYRADVLHNPFGTRTNLLTPGSIGNTTYTRVGSLINDPLALGFFMTVPFAVALERVGAHRMVKMASVVAGISAATVLLTITRGAIVSLGVIAILGACVGISRVSTERLRVVLVMIAAIAVLLPVAGQSAFVARMEGIFTSSHDEDTQLHITRPLEAARELANHPLGRGLGTNNSTGSRFDTGTSAASENSYLQTGMELGMPSMALFIAALIMTLIQLRRRSKEDSDASGLAGGVWLAGCGLAVGGLVLEVWYQLAVTLIFWATAAVALSVDRGGSDQRDDGEELSLSGLGLGDRLGDTTSPTKPALGGGGG
jgi:hypothetical protein